MALLFMDGFEGYGREDVPNIWDSGSTFGTARTIDQTGRRGGYATRATSWSSQSGGDLFWNNPNPSNDQVIIVGCAFKISGNISNSDYLMSASVLDGGAEFIKVQYHSSKTLKFVTVNYTNAVVHYTSPVLDNNTWYYVEMKGFIHASAAAVQFRINEELVADLTGLDTLPLGNSGTKIGKVAFHFASYGYVHMDDIYIADTTGSVNNDFLGDVRIDAIHPNGAGNHTDFTPSTGANYQCVDEINFDSSDYVEGANAGEIDSYTYPAVPTDIDDTAIYGVQLNNQAKRTATVDNIKIKGLLRTGSTDYKETTGQSLADSFLSRRMIWEDDPSDSGDWTQTKINACEFGVEVA